MKGATLIETLIYIGLLSLLIVGVFSSVYILIGSSERESRISEQDQILLLKNYHE